jgi:cysteinyl-tRNA synthetase
MRTAIWVAVMWGAAACGGDDGGGDDAGTADDATRGEDAPGADGDADADADADGDGDAACGERTGILAADDWAYQLQNLVPAEVGATAFDVIVSDYAADGTDETAFTTADLETMRAGPSERKIILSYLSIGEAEDYRFYWQAGWTPGAPAWLGPENPDWGGNYKVRYWDPEWQAIVFGYVDKIVAAGFDGIYLDIIDAYEYWEPLERPTARADMAAFVGALAARGRAATGCRAFYVVPQNAPEVRAEAGSLDVVDAIGVEDTFYNDDAPQDGDFTAFVLGELSFWRAAGKKVFSIDYVTQPATIAAFFARALGVGFVPYASVRELDVLTITPGHEPD